MISQRPWHEVEKVGSGEFALGRKGAGGHAEPLTCKDDWRILA